ncbi:hypothetical protein ASPZODRAFT_143710 [Penicilliopsis zonata CBS 506.65]|uniref:Uncharacterized protein n=1 Tax=Penicilliopsis zonata CBS 506.65 TaxID=1073090 RepID=A0A1L9SFF1_9EURO|nr:hypothetical protein ASPZODRAFT_143710 [Penicilliopsis zonata CBS 506.65]OJJ45833.1 hypothetical protein ASPZODRAFT_143710 [Penicilliopsis zonata CBS 506.65]
MSYPTESSVVLPSPPSCRIGDDECGQSKPRRCDLPPLWGLLPSKYYIILEYLLTGEDPPSSQEAVFQSVGRALSLAADWWRKLADERRLAGSRQAVKHRQAVSAATRGSPCLPKQPLNPLQLARCKSFSGDSAGPSNQGSSPTPWSTPYGV